MSLNLEIPPLEELLQEKTVFVLGAGASYDYGFPLWQELPNALIEEITKLQEDPYNYGDKGLTELKSTLDFINSDAFINTTVDRLSVDSTKHYITIQRLVALALTRCEQSDCYERREGWIERLASSLASQSEEIKKRNPFENLYFITLNYERCFQYRFQSAFYKNLVAINGEEKDSSLTTNFGTIYYPHGCIGSLPNSSFSCHAHVDRETTLAKVDYGSFTSVKGEIFSSTPPTIFPVDYFNNRQQTKVTYDWVNDNLLTDASTVIFIGVSPDGVSQSDLKRSGTKFPQINDNNLRVFTTGGEDEEYPPIFNNIKGYANDLIEKLCPL